ncbi:MAG: ABC transporter permease subunit [Gemmatimonadota bacterium]|nr:ABC transporter permease subunit [Gemmatimonadota bacterium]
MNTTLALFWKEGREAAYKIAACAGLAMIVALISAGKEEYHDTGIQIFGHLVGLFGAVLFGMDAVARERNRMTLSYLLCRPVESWKIIIVKLAVGATGLLLVLAAYWGAVFIEIARSEGWVSLQSQIRYADFSVRTFIPVAGILSEIGYIRVLSLWFLVYLIPYGVSVLASTLADHPYKAAMTSLMAVWVAFVLFLLCWTLAPPITKFYFRLLFSLKIMTDAEIVRQAFDTSLLLIRTGATAVLTGCTLLWACKTLRTRSDQRFQWTVVTLAIIGTIVVIGLNIDRSRNWRTPIAPVGSQKYDLNMVDLALKDGLAVVLLEQGLSVADVTDQEAPVEIGRVETDGCRLERLALSGARAYVWGEVRDSVGVMTFDLSQPDRPRLQMKSLMYPVEKGPTAWLRRIPRLVGWGIWKNHLYVGLIRDEFLEMHSFDVRNTASPRRIQELRIEQTTEHLWNNGWEMRIVDSHAFMVLGHDFVVLDLSDPGRLQVLCRTPVRRFGRSKNYEKLVDEVHGIVNSSSYKELLAQQAKKADGNSGSPYFPMLGSREFRSSNFEAPPGLGPLAVGNERVYVERHLPREIAVLDISDPRNPLEVDYIPWTHLPRRMTVVGASAYALHGGDIKTYAKTSYGTFSSRKKLGLEGYDAYLRGLEMVNLETAANHVARDRFIVNGDHIYAILNNNLAIFENPRKVE